MARADLAGEITASIICPGVIFGHGTGPYKTISSPFPNLMDVALKHKRAIYAGEVRALVHSLVPIDWGSWLAGNLSFLSYATAD